MSAEELAAPLAEDAAPEPRRRRGLNFAGGLGRSESGRSIRTLPEYTKEAGDEERVLLRCVFTNPHSLPLTTDVTPPYLERASTSTRGACPTCRG